MAFPPLVGLPSDRKIIGPHPFLAVGEKYVRALVDGAQATPVLLPSLQPPLPAAAWLDRLDGLVLTGSTSNIEPQHYAGGATWPGNLHDAARDGTTLPLIPEALRRGMPVLAICRGLQEVNVALGGTLHPKVHEVEGLIDHREDVEAALEVQYGPAHPVSLSAGGRLAAIAGRDEVRVNSLHGQGIAQLGEGLVVEALSPDGLIEAFRGAGENFLLAVQWHPEWRVRENPFYLGIFQAFGDACRAYAASRPTCSP
ncbi:MAG TPA: gamma-glutamyl-gamma-aminobutyrate hydrolase family protein [Stenotrophomonas sp.]|jgi:putative glutamine amidotransferase